jgi:hypothetical protein
MCKLIYTTISKLTSCRKTMSIIHLRLFQKRVVRKQLDIYVVIQSYDSAAKSITQVYRYVRVKVRSDTQIITANLK